MEVKTEKALWESSDSNGAPGIKSGRRQPILGFLVKPGMHNIEQEQPPGHLNVGSR